LWIKLGLIRIIRFKKKEYEEEQYCRGGGEGTSSRTHSIPDGDYDYVVRRIRTDYDVRESRAKYFALLHLF
jgi:hypothetical protein